MMLSASAELYSEKEKLVLGALARRVLCVYAIVSLDASLCVSLYGSENSHNTRGRL